MLVPVISGSDKTTVSVATGHQEYHPDMGIRSFQSHFFLFQKVSTGFFYIMILLYIMMLIVSLHYSKQTSKKTPWIPTLCAPSVPYVPSPCLCTASSRHDCARGCSMPVWSFPEGCVQSRTLHCWLPRTSLVGGNHSRLVSQVRNYITAQSRYKLIKH